MKGMSNFRFLRQALRLALYPQGLAQFAARGAAVVLLCVQSGVALASAYTVQYLPNAVDNGPGVDLNDSGTVVGLGGGASGHYLPRPTASVWSSPGLTMTSLGLPVSPAVAITINNEGAVAGTIGDGADSQPFVWQSGALTNLPVPSGLYSAVATGINDVGDVVGYAWGAGYGERHALLWHDGVVQDITDQTQANSIVIATGINNAGVVSGYTNIFAPNAVLWNHGELTYLPNTPFHGTSWAYAVSDSGDAAGVVSTASGTQAAIWIKGSLVTVEPFAGDIGAEAFDINSHGQAVGQSFGAYSPSPGSQQSQSAFLWDNGTTYDLGEMAGIPLSGAWAINEHGQILASSPTYGVVLLTPVPELSAWMGILIGLPVAILFSVGRVARCKSPSRSLG